jgi:hypothetical protein
MNVIDRFLAKVVKTEGCWLWTARKTPQGYGRFGYQGENRLAHRVAFELFKAPFASGLHVLHRCDNPGCVNPDHLFLGTNAANVEDKVSKGRAQRLEGERNGRSKLTEADVLAIRDAVARGVHRQELARLYGVAPMHINSVAARRSWRHV